MKLFIKLLRDIKQSIGQFIAFVLVIAVGAFFYAGLNTLSDNLSAYTKAYYKEHNLSDLNVYYKQISKQDVESLRQIQGINNIEGRLSLDATQSFTDMKASIKLHSIPENNEINTSAVMEGKIPLRKDEVLLDFNYAKEHNFQVGDQIQISMNDRNMMFTISGLAMNVEYVKKNTTQDHKASGFAYVTEAALPEIVGGLYYNEILVDAKEGYDIDQLSHDIEVQSKDLSYLSLVSKERSFSYSQLQQTIYNNKMMSTVIPLVLFIIEAIILFLTMSRIIDSQRNQVGTMKALGVKNKNIMLHYMGYPVLAGIVGSILGYVIAASVFIPMIVARGAKSSSLPDITYPLSIPSVFISIFFSSAFGIVACYLSARPILRERAAMAMRPKPPKKMKKLLIEKIPGFWQRISYNYKIILKNIFLNKSKALASSVGVVLSTALLITAFGTQMGLIQVADQIEKVNTYDLKVDYKRGTALNTLQLPTDVKNSYDLSTFPVEFIKGDTNKNATLVVTEKENNLIHFLDENEKQITLDDSGVLVPKSYANQYQIVEGDSIRIKFTEPELANKTVDMKVIHISTQYSDPSFYITPAYLKSFGIHYNPSSLLVEIGSSIDLPTVRNFFEQDQQVETVTDRNDLKRSAEYTLKQNSFVFIMFIISAVVLSFGTIYTISSINIYERNRELATLKVLGYPKNKINRLIFFENIILTTFSVIVAIPIGIYLFTVAGKAMASAHQQIPNQINLLVMVISVAIAYVLTILSNLLLRRKVSQINMIESLKSID
ncbi:ABC transporter permease [Paenibacillus sp. E194]|uniref:ABC transporter permease n=1 Tax=Paenibacillus sp. E194 TaxID=1458845 RepID=UPI0005C94A9D|nr:FtsX-like permease family protein [Paenibacillus sp. E194]KJB87183.1 ABC transporter permease [Paenibacillus sp. E194]